MMLSEDTKISIAIAPAAGVAATTDISGATLDMSGFEGVLMVVSFGAITGGAVTSIKVEQSDAANMSPATDLAGSGQTIAHNDDEKTFYIDIHKPLKRYLRLVVDRGTQNAVVASAHYIQYGPRKKVTAHGANVAGEAHVSPVAGTA